MSLRQTIEDEIRARGAIPFSRYMGLCLYHPELGYYSRNAEQFGKTGDFYTSSDVHAVFGRLLSRQFEEMWRALGSPAQIEILELGPGRGLFAQDVLDWSKKKFLDFFNALHYSLLEGSPGLRQRLHQTLQIHIAAGKASVLKPEIRDRNGREDGAQELSTTKVKSLERALTPEAPLIVFANEFFDALPVEIISSQGSLHLATEGNRFQEVWMPLSEEEQDFIDRYSVHPEPGERVEAPLLAQKYMQRITATMQNGFFIAIDYGYTRAEQLGGRHRGTLNAFRHHAVSNNPYEAPGEQDITAHVNFTALYDVAQKNGLETYPLRTQSQLLLGIGENNQFDDAFEECRLPQEHAKVALQLKHLITPEGMGESFKAFIASQGVELKKATRLSGLGFGLQQNH